MHPWMDVLPGLIILCGSVGLSAATCVKNNDQIICDTLDYDGESGIQAIVFVLSNVKDLQRTSFTNPKLKSVKSLTLGGNQIRSIEPQSFHGFPGLTSLLISNNDLRTVEPSWFYDSALLETLNVTSSKIQALEPRMLAGFSALKVLNFKNNSITEIRSGSFRNLSRLSHLDLSSNNISYLHRSALGSLQNATFRLDGNPWNCSCALREFSNFLQELQNTSRLDEAKKVMCHSPPALRGTPVQDVNYVNCSVSSTEETPADTFHQIILPALLVLLVKVLLILLILLLWKKIQEKKQVQPGREPAERKDKRPIGKRAFITFLKPEQPKSDSLRAIPLAGRTITQRGRSRSASAILLKGYCLQTHTKTTTKSVERHQDSHDMNVSRNEDPGNSSKGHTELWYYDSLQGGNITDMSHGISLNVNRVHTGVDENRGHTDTPYQENASLPKPRHVTMVPGRSIDGHPAQADINAENLEPLVYLSVSSSSEEPVMTSSTTRKVAHNEDLKPGCLRRTYTWPKEKVKCDQEPDTSYENFLKLLHLAQNSHGGHSSGQMAMSQGTLQSDDYSSHLAMFDMGSREKGSTGSRIGKEEIPPGSTSSKPRKGESRPHGGAYASVLPAQKVYDRSSRKNRSQRNRTSPDPGVQREELHSHDSSVRSNFRTTPDDDSLLENNEYNFIDLLHEVVENHGRWTRERWRQTHQLRIPSRSPPAS